MIAAEVEIGSWMTLGKRYNSPQPQDICYHSVQIQPPAKG